MAKVAEGNVCDIEDNIIEDLDDHLSLWPGAVHSYGAFVSI